MKKKGWSDRDLARESNIHITLIRRYFGKYVPKPTRIGPENAQRMADALNVERDAILYGVKGAA